MIAAPGATGIQDQTQACPVAPSPSPPDGRTGAPRPSGPTASVQAATGPHTTTPPFAAPDLALVALIAKGLSSATVATQAGLTMAQVKDRIERMIGEHKAGNRVGLVGLACRSGQIPGGYRPAPLLPPRLAEVLPMIAAGMSNRQIGYRLHLSYDGVRSRTRDLQAWLGGNNRPNTVLLAHRAGLLPEAER